MLKYIILTIVVDVSQKLIYIYEKLCWALRIRQKNFSFYTIDPDGLAAFDVFCDQTSVGGGWTVFQKRLDGTVDFVNRGWADFKRGFGNLNGEFWLGLDKMHRLTKTKSRLRVELEDTRGKTAYAEYDMFSVSSERNKYRLRLGIYTGECFKSVDWSILARIVVKDTTKFERFWTSIHLIIRDWKMLEVNFLTLVVW